MITLATISDLRELADIAPYFMRETTQAPKFDRKVFIAAWQELINNEVGVIFISTTIDGKIVGALGAIKYPYIYSHEMEAIEFFWFVLPEYRTGTIGLSLLHRYEEWAKANGCCRIKMGSLVDCQPEKLRDLYLRLGYTETEVAYTKVLSAISG